jgi:hypothetical protein
MPKVDHRRPYLVRLSERELHLIQASLWLWEDSCRSSRAQAKSAARTADVASGDAKIAETRNLKARMFRAKAIAT